MDKNDITPVSMIKNEDFWIQYVLRDVLDIFGRAIVLDTGSTDLTKEKIRALEFSTAGKLIMIEENYGDDSNKIGNGRNVLRELCPTYWMFLIDGDEIWTKPQLEELLKSEVPEQARIAMVGGRNIQDVSGSLKLRELANYDRLFAPEVRWKRTDYPFESHGLEDYLKKNQVHYFDGNKVFHWHVRHTIRSSQNSKAFFRNEKYNYYPVSKEYKFQELPEDWLGEKTFSNIYLEKK